MALAVERYFRSAKQWQDEMTKLRAIILATGLTEELKWGKPCYGVDGKNVAIIQTFKASLALMLFKGALLKDPKAVLVANGPNSQAARRFEFHSVAEITRMKATITAYLREAMAIEKAGLKVPPAKEKAAIPEELLAVFAKKPAVEKAFGALTPGRQRAYLLYFSSAKQAKTRLARIEKCLPLMRAGKGLNDKP